MADSLCHWYINSSILDWKYTSVFVGYSIIMYHKISTNNDIIEVQRLGILTALLASITHSYGIELPFILSVNAKKVNMRFPRVDNASSLIMGCNGGFQWMGSPHNKSENFDTIACMIASNMDTEEFVTTITNLDILTKRKYPAGIPRSYSM